MTCRETDPNLRSQPAPSDAECPYCGSDNTQREHARGPSLCRSIHYCNGCEQPFEQFE